jgi:hypothetical protein
VRVCVVVIVVMVVVVVMVVMSSWYVHFVGIVVSATLGRNLASQRVQTM